MKKLLFKHQIVVLFCTTIFFTISFSSLGQSPWTEDFESYSPGTWPPSWVADANATDLSLNYIDNSTASQGSQSLRLHGSLGETWSALAYHPLLLSAPIEIELDVKNGDETLTGGHPDRAYIGLRKGTSWDNPLRMLVCFKGDGTIESGGGNVTLGNYSTLTWYTVKIRYERIFSSQVKISYWINSVFKGYEILEPIEEEVQLDNLDLTSQEGTVWFDNVNVKTYVNSISNQNLSKIDLFPNPATDKINFRLSANEQYRINIYNILGEAVLAKVFLDKTKSIDISDFQKGVYFISIEDFEGNFILTKKIIKQ